MLMCRLVDMLMCRLANILIIRCFIDTKYFHLKKYKTDDMRVLSVFFILNFMKTSYKIYTGLSVIYLLLAVRYFVFLWNFDCDGIGCLSIALFTGPLTVGFIIAFSTTTIQALKLSIKSDMDNILLNEKMKKTITNTAIPFGLFTLILILLFFLVSKSYF